MNKKQAESIIAEYLKPVFGFALKRCKNEQDAEDLSQEILLKAFRALMTKSDIHNVQKFIWTIAHNTLNNYYRTVAKSGIGVPMDEVSERIAYTDTMLDGIDDADMIRRLQKEIAYLSKLQRQIVIAYYFENRKQSDIAEMLNVPLGTVKWHLFEAKKELKRGMDTMRNTSELKFNPIKFSSYGINGSIGTKSMDEFFRSTLAQNICYCVRKEAKTVNEIADMLGVSPVYVETEVDHLEEYGFLERHGNRYLTSFIIEEPTAELLTMQNAMYKKAAEKFANDLFDELMNSGVLQDGRVVCDRTILGSSEDTPLRDMNFLMWSLIPYIAACAGEELMDKSITFEEVATIRPDGAHNIAHASVVSEDMQLPDDYVYSRGWCGPYYDTNVAHMLWKIDTEWSGRRVGVNVYEHEIAERVLSLYENEIDHTLSKEDYAWLSEHGYIKMCGDDSKALWQVVILTDVQIRDKLLSIGETIKLKYKDVFASIKAPYVKAVLDSVPPHLRKIKEYELQFTFYSDGWFLLHCIVALLNNGKLKPPTEEQKKSLTTLILPNE